MVEFSTSYGAVRRVLGERLMEPAPGRLQLLVGPRQVGKTHLLLGLARGFGDRAIYAAADEPEAALSGWWEARWRLVQERATPAGPGVLLLDEIQYLPDWSRRLKAAYDRVHREGVPVHVVASGSSSLRLGEGARETLAGRFELHRLGHWPVADIAAMTGWTAEAAVDFAIRYGTYPGSVGLAADPARLVAYLRDAILEPAMGRDLAALGALRRPALLRQVFAIAVGHPAEVISLAKLRGSLADGAALETIAHYLELLREASLVSPLQKYSGRMVRRRAAPPKLVVLNQGLLAAMSLPGAALSAETSGRWVENACVALACNAGQEVSYWREEPLEVDFVSEGDWGSWAVEVKWGRCEVRDLAGLLEFTRRHPRFRPLLVHGGDRAPSAAAPAGVATRAYWRFLWEGPPAG